MTYIGHYQSSLGDILIAVDEIGVYGVWFENQKYYAAGLIEPYEEKETELILKVKRWLDLYFKKEQPLIDFPLHLIGTDFQKEVWEILCDISYGHTMTYGEIANILAQRRGVKRFSAQAVGGAVGHNRISIIVPCHRVLGSNGSLTGYAGGIDRKEALLELEGNK